MGEIADVLLKSTHEIYALLFSSDIEYSPINLNFRDDIYGEEKSKQYLPPVMLVGGIRTVLKENAETPFTADLDLFLITIPAKSFKDAGIDTTNTDYLKSGLFSVKGTSYSIISLDFSMAVQGEILSYRFTCRKL